MTELYAKIACGLPRDPRFLQAGPLARLLYVQAVLYSKENLTDGALHRLALPLLAVDIPDPAEHMQRLVDVGAVEETDSGWQIPEHHWTKWNRTAAEIEQSRAAKHLAAALTNHRRWHEAKGITDPRCQHCVAQPIAQAIAQPIASSSQGATAERIAKRIAHVSPETETETETEKPTHLSLQTQVPSDPHGGWQEVPRETSNPESLNSRFALVDAEPDETTRKLTRSIALAVARRSGKARPTENYLRPILARINHAHVRAAAAERPKLAARPHEFAVWYLGSTQGADL